ncbi:MAG: hypothetical protein QNK33_03550 [Bacteroidales bacterium]|nr:hypothetical protein [Bacteroidales bacterium]
MKRILITSIVALLFVGVYAQEEAKFGIKFSGFIKNDFFFDSRQTVNAREGHFLLWPSAENLDDNGLDINAGANFNMLAIQSRLKGSISGPDAFGAKTSGVIEVDFFAQANANINLMRMRHAFIKLDWTNVELLAGQYWNPLFVTDCFPGTVSFNTGTPIQSFARNPQIRIAYKTGGFKITAAALSQRDYSSRGPDGITSDYLRNSGSPDMHLQFQYGSKSESSGIAFVLGGGMAYKTITPRLESIGVLPTNGTFKVDEKVGGLTAIAFSKVTTESITVKFETRYGENIADVLAPSGFAVTGMVDLTTGRLDYTPLKSMSYWAEIHTNGKVQVGLFAGYFNSMGTKEELTDPGNSIYGLGTDISSLIRVSPRIIVNSGKTRVALEVEYSSAEYGNTFNSSHLALTTTSASNLRALLAMYYFF